MSLGTQARRRAAQPVLRRRGRRSAQHAGRRSSRGQLLRPYPEFNDVFALESTGARNRYNAGVVRAPEARAQTGWGGRFSYTYSRLKDNQFGETNNYSQVAGGTSGANVGRALNNYDLDAEYSRSILDVPHRLMLAPMVELPFGRGRRWLTQPGLADALAGGWTVAAIVEFESGFPLNVGAAVGDNTGTFGGEQRPNINSGVDPNTSGSRRGPVRRLDQPRARYSLAPAFTFGNAPRTNPDLRTPDRNNIDLVISKDMSLTNQVKGQIRLEMLNLTNHVKTNGVEQRLGRIELRAASRARRGSCGSPSSRSA